MLKYNNNHIFTGYLKQLLSSYNLPTCRVYTREFAEYYTKNGKEDPRVLESFDKVNKEYNATRINYLKDNEIYNYFWPYAEETKDLGISNAFWKKNTRLYYDETRKTLGLTRNLHSPGMNYDTKTHEYLGDYLRFLRDYHNINLMSLYNCFNNKIYNNIYFNFSVNAQNVLFNAQEAGYRIYA